MEIEGGISQTLASNLSYETGNRREMIISSSPLKKSLFMSLYQQVRICASIQAEWSLDYGLKMAVYFWLSAVVKVKEVRLAIGKKKFSAYI